MTINATDLKHYVIQPTLELLESWSPAAESLLLGTAAQGSNFDPFSQRGSGLGIYQISSEQHRDIWDNYLAFLPELASKVRGLASQHQFLKNPDHELRINLAYSTAIAWLIYSRSKHQLPAADDDEALGEYWHRNFKCPMPHQLQHV